jgi:hypothetical protein
VLLTCTNSNPCRSTDVQPCPEMSAPLGTLGHVRALCGGHRPELRARGSSRDVMSQASHQLVEGDAAVPASHRRIQLLIWEMLEEAQPVERRTA